METGPWVFLALTAIGVTLMAFGEIRRPRGNRGEEFDDFVERESANVGVTSDVGIVRTLKSVGKSVSHSASLRPRKAKAEDFFYIKYDYYNNPSRLLHLLSRDWGVDSSNDKD